MKGLGYFGDDRPSALWEGVAPSSELDHLQAKVTRALRMTGDELERRKFKPHVTLAYLNRAVPESECASYCARHGLFSCGPFPVDEFHLYSSAQSRQINIYEIEASYAFSFSI